MPDYSPAMLRLFIEGRVVLERTHVTAAPSRKRAAEQTVYRRIGHASGLPAGHVAIAHRGLMNRAGKRAALWSALGVYPADTGTILTDDGGQIDAAR